MPADPELVIEPHELIENRLWRLRVQGREPCGGRAVVFVHGYTGDADNTWKAKEAEAFPHLIAKDPSLQDHDIFLLQYATGFFLPPDIDNIVQQFAFALKEYLTGYSIVFVAHSMGGLVCMKYVLRQLENAAPVRVVGLLTYGTPMTGVEWIKYAGPVMQVVAFKIPVFSWIAGFFKKNRQLENMKAGGEFIDRLTSQWVLRVLNGGYPSIPPNLRTWLPTRVVTGNDDWVVTESSAKGFYGDIDWIPLDKGHIAMIKPAGPKDEAYQIARDFIKQCRGWIGPASALKLREQADNIWRLHTRRRISDWTFDISFSGHEAPGGSPFGMPGFGVFTVRECSYRRFLDGPTLKFGFAFGAIATDSLWTDQFVYLHRLHFRGLSQPDAAKIVGDLRVLLAKPADAWHKLFADLKVTVGTDTAAVALAAGDPHMVDDGIICDFELPKQFIGKEERVCVSFQSLLPLSIRHYRIWFPWLCETFSATANFGRPLAFLAPGQAMRGTIEAKVTEEASKIKFQSKELVLPESYIQMEWLFSDEGGA